MSKQVKADPDGFYSLDAKQLLLLIRSDALNATEPSGVKPSTPRK